MTVFNSKQKGNAGERELAKILSNIFAASFIRVPASGAFIGGKNAIRKTTLSNQQIRNAKGDLIPPDHMPCFNVECKSVKALAFHQLLQSDCPQLNVWIDQAQTSADLDDVVFICFKINRLGWFTAFHNHHITGPRLSLDNHAMYKHSTGIYIITSLPEFFSKNRSMIEDITKP